MRTHSYSIPLALAVVGIVTLLASACDSRQSPSAPSPTSVAPGVSGGSTITVQSPTAGSGGATVSASGANTAAVCHLVGNGTYHLLHVDPHALDAHRRHGDVLPENGECPAPITPTVRR
jgi:hypothetical protein